MIDSEPFGPIPEADANLLHKQIKFDALSAQNEVASFAFVALNVNVASIFVKAVYAEVKTLLSIAAPAI